MANRGYYDWIIQDDEYDTLLRSKIGVLHRSNIFEIGGFKWQLHAYPNGQNGKEANSFMIHLKLLNLPQEFEKIIIQRKFECINTSTSSTSIALYSHTEDGVPNGWKPRCLLLSELFSLNITRICIKISIKIIRITPNMTPKFSTIPYVDIDNNLKCIDYDDHNRDVHNHQHNNNKNISSAPFHDRFYFKRESKIIWHIDDKETIQHFVNSHHGKRMEMPFDSNNNDLFILHCYPNGKSSQYRNNITLGVTMVNLPIYEAYGIKVYCVMSCQQNEITKSFTSTFYIDDHDVNCRMFTNCQLIPNQPITFILQYEILNIININSLSISISKWPVFNEYTTNHDMLMLYQDNFKRFDGMFNHQSLTWLCSECQVINHQNDMICKQCKLNRTYLHDPDKNKITKKFLRKQPDVKSKYQYQARKEDQQFLNIAQMAHCMMNQQQYLYNLRKSTRNTSKKSRLQSSPKKQRRKQINSVPIEKESKSNPEDVNVDNTGKEVSSSDYDAHPEKKLIAIHYESDMNWTCPLCAGLNSKQNEICMICECTMNPELQHKQKKNKNKEMEEQTKDASSDDVKTEDEMIVKEREDSLGKMKKVNYDFDLDMDWTCLVCNSLNRKQDKQCLICDCGQCPVGIQLVSVPDYTSFTPLQMVDGRDSTPSPANSQSNVHSSVSGVPVLENAQSYHNISDVE